MRNIYLAVIAFMLLCVSCNVRSYNPLKAVSSKEKQCCQKDTTLKGRISKILSKEFGHQIMDLKIEIVQLDKRGLFWSDPGYISGPEIAIEDTCYAVSFTTHTFMPGDGGYSDDYVLYFPFHKNFGIWYNRYYGRNYHGGSLKVVPDSTDKRFGSLQEVLVHPKDKMWNQIEQELQKK